jgi:protein gp37
MASKIEWTHETWNPVTGCHKVSEGCRHCYAERLSLEQGWSKKPWVRVNAPENVKLHEERLGQPLSWQRSRMVFVNSMSDLFHPLVPFDFIDKVWDVMAKCRDKHTFQILTKRPRRMFEYFQSRGLDHYLPNVWLGVSTEDQKAFDERVPILLDVQPNKMLKFLSMEPLIAPVEVAGVVDKLDWVIVGGESGPGCRPMDLDWVRPIRDACVGAKVPFFLKQLGGHPRKRGGVEAVLDGRRWAEMPSGHPVWGQVGFFTEEKKPVQMRLL